MSEANMDPRENEGELFEVVEAQPTSYSQQQPEIGALQAASRLGRVPLHSPAIEPLVPAARLSR